MADDLRYPVGSFDPRAPVSREGRPAAIEAIAALPTRLRAAVDGLDDVRLDSPYRPGGWTVRQLVHHIADSHLNGYVRLKLALTEDHPTIKAYEQDAWATLADSRLPIEVSLRLAEGVHARWTALLRALEDADFARTFQHPEIGPVTVETLVQLYGWHSRHHVAHITALRSRQGW